jgi:hypothetical protein
LGATRQKGRHDDIQAHRTGTGASSGIGRAIAQALLADGSRVVAQLTILPMNRY